MKRENLKLFFKEAVINSLLELKLLLQDKQYVMLCPIEEPRFLPDGSLSETRIVFRPRILHSPELYERILKIPQVLELCEFIANSDISAQLVAKQAATPAAEQVFYRLFMPFLKHYLSGVEDLDFNQDVFQDTYEGILAYFDTTDIKLMFFAPLLGFDTQADEGRIELAPNVVINRMSPELKKQLWHDASISSSWSKEDVSSLKYQATFEEYVPKTNLFSYSAYPEDIENLQPLLRLVQREPISIMCVVVRSSPWYLASLPDSTLPSYFLWATAKPLIGRWLVAPLQWQPVVLPISFSPEEIENLRSLWASLVSMRNQTRLIMALHRFGLSYERPTPEDKLIDLWVGLEALFSEGLNYELSYRIPLRIAYFLGKTADKRKKIFEEIRDSYECRSKVVHGKKSKKKPANITRQTEGHLAESIKSCLHSRTLPSADELDAKVLKGG